MWHGFHCLKYAKENCHSSANCLSVTKKLKSKMPRYSVFHSLRAFAASVWIAKLLWYYHKRNFFLYQWHPPASLDFTPSVELGCKSVERQIQLERERYVLQAIYFSHESIPISPEEPEKEEFEAKLAVEIPLEDVCLSAGHSLPKFASFILYFPNKYVPFSDVSVLHRYTDGSEMSSWTFFVSLQGNEVKLVGISWHSWIALQIILIWVGLFLLWFEPVFSPGVGGSWHWQCHGLIRTNDGDFACNNAWACIRISKMVRVH